MPLYDVLFVDPRGDEVLATIRHVLEGRALVEACTDFNSAKARVRAKPPNVLVTNLRLHAYNGLHLVILAGTAASTRCLVYAEPDDFLLAREAQRLGAFYERASNVRFSLPGFMLATLPAADRRNAAVFDRRVAFRGGRRGTDFGGLTVGRV